MNKYWREPTKRMLQALLILTMLLLFNTGVLIAGSLASSGTADTLVILVFILLWLIMIVLNFLIIKTN